MTCMQMTEKAASELQSEKSGLQQIEVYILQKQAARLARCLTAI